MAIFTAIATAIGAAFGAGAFFVSATAFVLQTAAGIGLNLLAQKIAGKKQPQQQQSTGPGFSVQGTLRAAGDVPRSFIVGKFMTAGSLVYANTWGQDGETPNAYLTQVIALSDLPVKGLSEVWVNGEKCTLGSAHPTFGQRVTQYAKDGQDYLWIKFHDGTQVTADSFLTGTVSNASRPYENTRVGVGVAYVICTARVEESLFTGFPQFKFVVDGVKLYDPTEDDTNGGDGDHRWDNPSTWGGDGDYLPAVQLYNIVRGIEYGGEWFYGLQGISGTRLPASNWNAQIAKCRESVTGPSGAEPQYRSGGEIVIANPVADTAEQLLTACQGKLSEIGGFYKIHVGEPGSPTFSFTDDDIISTEEQSFTPFFGLADTINGVSAKYPSPEDGWNVKAAPPLYRTDLEVYAGNRRLMADVSLDFVPYAAQVQRLMKSALQEAQRARRHTFTLPPQYWIVEPGDIGQWTSERNGYEEKLFRVDGVIDKANLDVIVDLTEVDPSDYDFDIEVDYTPQLPGNLIMLRPEPQPMTGWQVEPYTFVDAESNARRPGIEVSFAGGLDDISGVRIQVRLDGTSDVVFDGESPYDRTISSPSVALHGTFLPNTAYEARGIFVSLSGREFEWSEWLDVTTPDIGIATEELSPTVRALLDRVKELSGDLFSMKRDLDTLANAVVSQGTSLQEFVGRAYQALGTRYNENKAAAESAMQVAVTAESALAAIFQGVFASTEAGEAEALLKMAALSDTELQGALAAIEVALRAGRGGTFAEAAFRLAAILDPVLGNITRFDLKVNQAFMDLGNGVIIPMHSLRRHDEAKDVPVVAGTPNTITVDLSTRHDNYYTLLTDNAEYQFPLNPFVGSWRHTFQQPPGGGKVLTVDDDFYILNINGFDPPLTTSNALTVYEFGIARLFPQPAAYWRKIQEGLTATMASVISITPAVEGRTVWNFQIHGPLVLGPGTYTIVPLGDDVTLNITLWGAGGSSGGAAYGGNQGSHWQHPGVSTGTAFTGPGLSLTAGAGTRSLTAPSNYVFTAGGAGGVASGGDININGNPGGNARDLGSVLTSGEGGNSADAAGGAGRLISWGSFGTVHGLPGGTPGAGASGGINKGNETSNLVVAAGGGGAGAKVIATRTLTEDAVYTITVGAAGAAGWGNSPTPVHGAVGGNGRAVLSV